MTEPGAAAQRRREGNGDEDLRLLADSARDFAMIFTDHERRVVRWSAGAEHVLGWTEDEAIGKNEIDLIFTPEDKAASVPQQEQDTALREGRAEDDRWHLKKDGTRFFASGVMMPLYDPQTGALRGFGKVLRDNTGPKRAEHALRASEARSTAVFAGAAVGLSEISPEGAFLRVNDTLCQILGRPREELLRLDVAAVTLAEDLPRTLETVRRVLETGGAPQSLDKRYVRPDGSLVWASSTVSQIRPDPDAPPVLVAITVDISERKRAEQALREAYEEVEARVQQRTRALETLLSERRELVRQIVTVQEEERRRISRELHDRTGQHLTGLALGLKALEDIWHRAPAAAAATEASPLPLLERLRAAADQMARDLHHIAMELRPTSLEDVGLPVALQTYVQEWAQRFAGGEAEFDSSGFEGHERLPPDIETTIYRVVQEALTNVLRHATPKARRVGVLLDRRAREVQAIVEDDGPGFDPGGEATGRLGLTGMRERAALAGGTLEIESAPGQGTTVFLRLPLTTPKDIADTGGEHRG